jgi:hypothetical protein
MLHAIAAAHFTALEGQVREFETVDGHRIVLRVDGVKLKPATGFPGEDAGHRTPFTVNLTAVEPTAFVHGLCAVELPELGRVENMMVSRQAALARDPQLAYFQILFN